MYMYKDTKWDENIHVNMSLSYRHVFHTTFIICQNYIFLNVPVHIFEPKRPLLSSSIVKLKKKTTKEITKMK